jgi:hypothetical protein
MPALSPLPHSRAGLHSEGGGDEASPDHHLRQPPREGAFQQADADLQRVIDGV